MVRVSVMYPRGGKFDFDYYSKKHMSLVHKLLDSFGLIKSEVNRGVGDSPFIAIGHLVFDSMENMQKGLQAHDPELAADLVNFSDIKPQFQISEILE
ncbi:MAG: EthD family reductase [Acidobacteria bacterium]|nr:EthD family reductase [Acidobacteriota bacterium]